VQGDVLRPSRCGTFPLLSMHGRLIRRAIGVNWRSLSLGHRVMTSRHATFIRNLQLPCLRDANFAFGVSAKEPGELDAFLDRLNREYAHARWLTVQADLHTPPAVEARLVDEHFERGDRMLLVLDGDLRRTPPRLDIRAMDDESSWQVFAELKRSGWQEHAALRNREAVLHLVEGLVAASRLRCPPVEYLMASVNGVPVGYCSVWEGLHGVGQVEDLFVDRHHRGRGIGTALLHRCVALARSRGAGPIIIAASDNDSTNELYSALGWRPLTICRQYSRRRVSPCLRCDAQM